MVQKWQFISNELVFRPVLEIRIQVMQRNMPYMCSKKRQISSIECWNTTSVSLVAAVVGYC